MRRDKVQQLNEITLISSHVDSKTLKSYAEKGAELLLKYTLKNYTYFYLFHI